MASDLALLYYGALLHDIGKILYRANPTKGTHAQLGADFILNEIAVANDAFDGKDGQFIVEQIRYHHIDELETATGINDDSLAYITCFANMIATGMDRANEGSKEWPKRINPNTNLRSIFNKLNGHEDDNTVEHENYGTIAEKLQIGLKNLGISLKEVNSLLNLLELTTSYIPTSTDTAGLIDVPLFDHLKVTAGISACVYEYLREQDACNFAHALFRDDGIANAYESPMFLLFSCDMSGIQDFIYNISGDGALKQLRARSLYLELLLEHIVDELLTRVNLNRSNLLYTGGGHAYLLLPNTMATKTAIQTLEDELNAWFVEHFKTDLYVASAWVTCCANDLANKGENVRYAELYRYLSRELSEAKAARYDATTIRKLNFEAFGKLDHIRECSECHRSDLRINKDGKCTLCAALGSISRSLIDKDVFTVARIEDPSSSTSRYATLDLPFNYELRTYTCEGYKLHKSQVHRTYAKNGRLIDNRSIIDIWMGDYAAPTDENGIADYVDQSATLGRDQMNRMLGIRRLGVLRADVDDLGTTFVSGLPNERVSISRTSTLSRTLSRFFKLRINDILAWNSYQVQIIYSGGDDLFIIGNWSDIIYAAIDIRRGLDEYTGNGALTISGGIGMFEKSYPIARMAEETGELENEAKNFPPHKREKSKNAIALWSNERVFSWDEFIGTVTPRVHEISQLFEGNEKGFSFIYRLIDLLRNYKEVSSAPQLAYLLARSFEDCEENNRDASKELYNWASDPSERRYLLAALEWYVYSVRKRSEQ